MAVPLLSIAGYLFLGRPLAIVPEAAMQAAAAAINKAGGFFTSIGKQFKVEVASDELTLVVKQIEQLQASIDRQGSDSALDKRMKGLRDRAAALSKEVSDATGWLKRFSEAANPYVDEAAKKREDRGFVPALQSINVPKPPAKITAFMLIVR